MSNWYLHFYQFFYTWNRFFFCTVDHILKKNITLNAINLFITKINLSKLYSTPGCFLQNVRVLYVAKLKLHGVKALVDRDLFIISEDIVAVEIVDWELGGGDSRLITPSSSMLNWKFSNLLLFFSCKFTCTKVRVYALNITKIMNLQFNLFFSQTKWNTIYSNKKDKRF